MISQCTIYRPASKSNKSLDYFWSLARTLLMACLPNSTVQEKAHFCVTSFNKRSQDLFTLFCEFWWAFVIQNNRQNYWKYKEQIVNNARHRISKQGRLSRRAIWRYKKGRVTLQEMGAWSGGDPCNYPAQVPGPWADLICLDEHRSLHRVSLPRAWQYAPDATHSYIL